MRWNGTDTHSRILALAFAKTLGPAQRGAMAFVRCLTPNIVLALAKDTSFEVRDWDVKRVADGNDEKARTVTADRAVEIRETKKDATLLLVDTELSGAGMDGIYSATCEVGEENLLGEALKTGQKGIAGRTPRVRRKSRQKGEDTQSPIQRIAVGTARLSLQDG